MPKMPKAQKGDAPDVVVLSRYSREDYPACRALPPADNGMEETYDEWLDYQKMGIAAVAAQGYKPEFVDVRSDEFSAWLKAYDLPNSPESRARYVHEVASARYVTKQ